MNDPMSILNTKQELENLISETERDLISAQADRDRYRRDCQRLYAQAPDNVQEQPNNPEWMQQRRAALAEREQAHQALKDAAERCATLEKALASHRAGLAALATEDGYIDALREEVKAAAATVQTIADERTCLQEQSDQVEADRHTAQQHLQQLEQQRAAALNPASVKSLRESFDSAQRELSDLDLLADNLRVAIDQATRRHTDAQTLHQNAQHALARAQMKLAQKTVQALAADALRQAYTIALQAGQQPGSMGQFAAAVFKDVPLPSAEACEAQQSS